MIPRNAQKCSLPVIRDRHNNLSQKGCRAPSGGAKTAGVPKYVLVVKNLPDPNSTSS